MDPPLTNASPLVNTALSSSTAPTLSTRSVARRVMLLCEWAVTPYRKNPYSVRIAVPLATKFIPL